MMHVPILRANALYDRSLELAGEVYGILERYQEILHEQDTLLLRTRAVRITKKIERAIVQHNKKMKLKLLNEAKKQLLLLLDQVY